jgi:hypothetical protein
VRDHDAMKTNLRNGLIHSGASRAASSAIAMIRMALSASADRNCAVISVPKPRGMAIKERRQTAELLPDIIGDALLARLLESSTRDPR